MCLMFNVTNVSNVIIMIKMKIGLMSLLSINKSEQNFSFKNCYYIF